MGMGTDTAHTYALDIACMFLNPLLKARLFNPNKLLIAMLLGILCHLYTRVFRLTDSPPGLMQEIVQYYNDEGIYSKGLWPVEELQGVCKAPVCFKSRFSLI
jgi:hypothetical protein